NHATAKQYNVGTMDEVWKDLIKAVPGVVAGIFGLVGVALGSFLTMRNQRGERRERFLRDQLSEFYAPILGIRQQLRARVDIRQKVTNAAATVWPRADGGGARTRNRTPSHCRRAAMATIRKDH